MRNRVPFILCIIGGALMIYAGAVGSAGIWGTILHLAQGYAPELQGFITVILTILLNIASMGGIAVIIGGFLITTNRVGTGKFIIGIAAGMGIFGFIMLIYTMYTDLGIAAFVEILNILATSAAVAGPVITIIARFKIKKPE